MGGVVAVLWMVGCLSLGRGLGVWFFGGLLSCSCVSAGFAFAGGRLLVEEGLGFEASKASKRSFEEP